MAARPCPWFWRDKAGKPWDGTIVARKIDERTVVDDAGIAFADDRRLHPIAKHFARSAAQSLGSGSMAAQDGRQPQPRFNPATTAA
jgi:hypothetical protein